MTYNEKDQEKFQAAQTHFDPLKNSFCGCSYTLDVLQDVVAYQNVYLRAKWLHKLMHAVFPVM